MLSDLHAEVEIIIFTGLARCLRRHNLLFQILLYHQEITGKLLEQPAQAPAGHILLIEDHQRMDLFIQPPFTGSLKDINRV